MRLGLASIYSFRPHVEHLYFLATLLKQAGHELFFLTCDGVLSNCYARALKGTSKLAECPKCIAGGVRSYPLARIQSLGRQHHSLNQVERDMLASSSPCTLLRTETNEDTSRSGYLALRETFYSPVETAFGSAVNWIEKNRLDGIICFNGRMEVTRAITYACEKLGVPYLSQERTWFSDGLQLIPQGNCLSLKEVNRLNRVYREISLSEQQARRAAKLIASRFVRTNLNEWRAYNLNSTQTCWPATALSGPKVLILPSSRNEFQGHPEWESSWQSAGQSLDWVLDALGIDHRNVVLRCHPNWHENIGRVDGSLSENYYADWAKHRGIHCIASAETASTFDLIQECDFLIVNGSSAAFEAGGCGKKIICLGHASYEEAGIAVHLYSENDGEKLKDLDRHDPADIIRKTLRHGYTMARRFPQYVDHVKALSPTRYRYFDGADPDRVVRMLRTGLIEADDVFTVTDDREESAVVAMVSERRWNELAAYVEPASGRPPLDIGRRAGLRWLDYVRERMPRGDR